MLYQPRCDTNIEYNTLYYGIHRVVFYICVTRGTSPTVGRIARRPEGNPTSGRAKTEGNAEYTVLYFNYVIPT